MCLAEHVRGSANGGPPMSAFGGPRGELLTPAWRAARHLCTAGGDLCQSLAHLRDDSNAPSRWGVSSAGVVLFAAVAASASPELPRSLAQLRPPLAAAVRKAAPSWLRDETDDLTQLALLRLDRALKREPDRRLTRAYLGRIAYTTVVDEIRKRRKEREHTSYDAKPVDRPAPGPDPERLASGAGAGEAITACLESAGPRARDALTLYLLGHSVPEIARLLDHTRKTAENIVYRGLAVLRSCVEAKGYRP